MSSGARRLSGKRGVVIGALVAAVAIGGGLWWGLRSSGGTSSASAIERTVEVTTGPLRQTVTASGTLKPADTEDLNFAVPGKVTAVSASAGQKVAKGDTLATVDSAALQSAVAQTQAAVDSAQARLSTETANAATAAQLAADSAAITAAQASLASAQASLAGASLVSPIDGTVASVNLTVGQQLGGSGSSASSLVGSATGSGQTRPSGSAGSGSAGAATGNTGSGSGATGSSSTAEVEVISTESYVVDIGIDDTQIGRVAMGQPATVTLSSSAAGNAGAGGGGFGGFGGGRAAAAGLGQGQGQGQAPDQGNAAAAPGASGPGSGAPGGGASATGTVTSVGVIATSTSGVATFPVVVTVAGHPSELHAGATASVAITYQELPDVVQVPVAAVTRANGKSSVTVSADGKKSVRPIVTGITAGGQVQVTSGLSAGESVVVTIPVAGNGGANANTGRTGTGTGNGNGTGRPGPRTFGGGG